MWINHWDRAHFRPGFQCHRESVCPMAMFSRPTAAAFWLSPDHHLEVGLEIFCILQAYLDKLRWQSFFELLGVREPKPWWDALDRILWKLEKSINIFDRRYNLISLLEKLSCSYAKAFSWRMAWSLPSWCLASCRYKGWTSFPQYSNYLLENCDGIDHPGSHISFLLEHRRWRPGSLYFEL